jgi:quercetin dioxygenase-like cupin family protein
MPAFPQLNFAFLSGAPPPKNSVIKQKENDSYGFYRARAVAVQCPKCRLTNRARATLLPRRNATALRLLQSPSFARRAIHRHPGLTFAYVLAGEITSKVDDEAEKTYAIGEMWMETPGRLHSVSRNASPVKPAKLVAILLAEKRQTVDDARVTSTQASAGQSSCPTQVP